MIKRFDNRDTEGKKKFYEFLKTLDPAVYVVKIDKDLPVRTLDQNSYYWFVLNIISLETGEDSDSLHVHFKDMFLKQVKFKENGKFIVK
jgi:hypothetical protein